MDPTPTVDSRRSDDAKDATAIGGGLGQTLVNFLTTALLLGVLGYICIDFYRATARGANSPLDVPGRMEPLPLAGAATLGSPHAKAGLIVFSDFECGSCGRFARETMSFLKRQYVDQSLLKIAYRHYPLPTHQYAVRLAQAAECAGAQGQFWDAHDRIFDAPPTRLSLLVRDLPADLDLDQAAFASCLSSDPRTFIERDRRLGVRFDVTGTPTIFVGHFDQNEMLVVSEVIRGAQPTAVFRDAIERVVH